MFGSRDTRPPPKDPLTAVTAQLAEVCSALANFGELFVRESTELKRDIAALRAELIAERDERRSVDDRFRELRAEVEDLRAQLP